MLTIEDHRRDSAGMRYIYPVLFIVPFVAAVTVTWPRPASKPRI